MSRTGDAVRHPHQGDTLLCPRRRSFHRRRPPPLAFTEIPVDPLLPVVLACCCGIDVHKKSLTACLLTCGASEVSSARRQGGIGHVPSLPPMLTEPVYGPGPGPVGRGAG